MTAEWSLRPVVLLARLLELILVQVLAGMMLLAWLLELLVRLLEWVCSSRLRTPTTLPTLGMVLRMVSLLEFLQHRRLDPFLMKRVALSSVVRNPMSVSCRSHAALRKRLCPSGLRAAWRGTNGTKRQSWRQRERQSKQNWRRC